MNETFDDKIRYKAVFLRNAQELAAYNFKLHPSVLYLDLATNEDLVRDIQPSSFKAIFTEEDLRKRIVTERQILYRFHLDLPVNLESLTCQNRTRLVKRDVFHIHLKQVCTLYSVYNRGLERYIATAIENDERRIEKLRTYMKVFEFLNFGESNDSTVYLCDSILTMLYEENCQDSELLKNFLEMFLVPLWLSRSEIPRVLEYVLLQVQRAKYARDLWRCLDQRLDPATFCFLCHKAQSMHLLIKYGTITFIPVDFDFDIYIPGSIFNRAIDLGIASYSRVFRVFQLFFDFLFHQDTPEGLRSLWRSIKDPFLSATEINSVLEPMIPSVRVKDLREYYVNHIIAKDGCNSEPTPRTLKDLCRVDIRRFLSFNYQIPGGVYGLALPETLKAYLNLER